MKHSFPFLPKRLLASCLSFCFAITFLTGCDETETLSFEEYTNELFVREITTNTLNLHYSVEDPSSIGIDDYDISLGDYSKESRNSSYGYLLETKAKLQSYSNDSLTLEEHLTYDVLMDYLDTQIALSSYDLYQEPLTYSGGLQIELPVLLAEYEFQSEQDVKEYLELIALTDEYFAQIMDFEKEKSEAGLFMSDELCELVIDSCEAFLENIQEHYLLTTFESRLQKLDLSEQKNTAYIKKNQEILEEQLFPAYKSMITELKVLLGTGTNDGGVCHFENGKDYYELLVYAETGCNDSMDEIYRRIELQRLEDLLACSALQSEDETILEQCAYLEWEMTDFDSALAILRNALLESFPSPPDTTCTINYVTPELEEYLAPAFYIVAPVDDYKENVIYINENYISSDIYSFTTLAHEGYPGHLYQTVMTYTYDFPEIRSILDYSGFVEGWATYVEMMSYYYAGLDESVASFLSHNQAATLSLYASSDIGLHYYGWTIEDMYRFWSGFGITNTHVIDEITQLILSEPGNYLKYYVGYLEFLDLKEYAEDLYGSDFSEIQFHQAILDIGPAPFSIVEEYFPKFYSSPQT